LLLKHGSLKICISKVCIKTVSAERGKLVNVFGSDLSFIRNQLIPDLQFFKIFFKGMNARYISFRMWLIYVRNSSQHTGRTLNGGTLQIMFHSSQATHFFATTCSAGTTMYQ